MRPIDLIGIPIDIGAQKSGARDGPRALSAFGILEKIRAHLAPQLSGEAITYRNLRELHARDIGHAAVYELYEPTRKPLPPVYYRKEIEQIGARAGAEVFRSLRLGHTPLILGGDHSISSYTNSSALKFFLEEGARVGLIWPDAHFDGHTEYTSLSHNANGMPLRALLGEGCFAETRKAHLPLKSDPARRTKRSVRLVFQPHQVLHVGSGTTHVEEAEREFFLRKKIATFPMEMLIANGGAGWVEFYRYAHEWVRRFDVLLMSVDLDVIHQHWAPGVTLPSTRGMLGPEALALMDFVRDTGKLRHIEFMEHNSLHEELTPITKTPRTAEFVTELACRVLTAE